MLRELFDVEEEKQREHAEVFDGAKRRRFNLDYYDGREA